MMNLAAVKGHKVALTHPEKGFDVHREAARTYLDLNVVYTVQRVANSMLYTRVWLQECPLIEFNAIQFDDV